MIRPEDFPRLTPENHRVTSPRSARYNCIALAVDDTSQWWEPGVHWLPADHPEDDFSLRALEQLFVALGYESGEMDASLEPGFVKVALYGAAGEYTHAARQLSDGRWISKLGKGVDIAHDAPADVGGGAYGEVAAVMKKRITPPNGT
jgi:hypothetical protein